MCFTILQIILIINESSWRNRLLKERHGFLCSPQRVPWTHPPQGSSKIRRHLDVKSWGVQILGLVNLHLIYFWTWWIFTKEILKHSKFWMNWRFIVLSFSLFESESWPTKKSAWWILTQSLQKKSELIVNLDLTIVFEKVNRGEDLRWVGSRCPLTRA